VCLSAAGPVQAGTSWIEKQKLLASDSTALDEFGISVSISGNLAIVGARIDDDKGMNSGSAYIFTPNDIDHNNWVQQAKLLASDGEAYDYFGWSVSISGDLAIAGAARNDDNGENSGSAYIFKRDGTVWTQQAKLLASDSEAGDQFGVSVSISGDLAIVGAPYNDDDGANSGSAYIFKRDGTVWTQQAKLTAADGAAGDYFGMSVSISGDSVIVGAWSDDDDGSSSGSAYIFSPNDIDPNNWIQQQKLLASDGAAGDYFGWSVFISRDLAIVGAYGDDDYGSGSGSAYIFTPNDINHSNWVQQQKLLAHDGSVNDNFGVSVSISGDLAIVGAYHGDGHAIDSGSAYIFRRDGASWAQQAELFASDGADQDYFAWSVSISGDSAIVGAYGNDDYGNLSGSAYIFAPCANWLTADLSGDCFVDFADFAIMAAQWLKCGNSSDPNCQPGLL
jgi:hypothetical protein